MSEYAKVANKVMEVLESFSDLKKLVSDNPDIAFFAKMELTVAITKAIAKANEKAKPIPLTLSNRYFCSNEVSTLWVASDDSIYGLKDGTWENLSHIWNSWEELYDCADVMMLTYEEYLNRLKGRKTAPNDIPF